MVKSVKQLKKEMELRIKDIHKPEKFVEITPEIARAEFGWLCHQENA